jgi:membrane protein YdbS with pleckstrin-like domain
MLFENNEIDSNQLPSIENLSFEPLKPQYRKIMYFNWSLVFLLLPGLPFLAEIIIEKDLNQWWFIVFYALIVIIYITGLVIINIGFPIKGYALRTHDIVYRSGYLNRRIITVPFNRIQHTEIRQSMIARMLGLSKLKIFTAGGHNSGLYIHGITPEKAQQLKDFLSKTVNNYE